MTKAKKTNKKKTEHAHKTAHHSSKKKDISGENSLAIWRGIAGILTLFLLISILTEGFSTVEPRTTMPIDEKEKDIQEKENNNQKTQEEESEIKLTVINDQRCQECQQMSTQVIQLLGEMYPDMEIKRYDYSEKKGKEIYDKNSLSAVPAFLFSENVKDSANYSQISRYVAETEDYLNLNVGSTFDPSSEICDNGKDDTGNGKVDCEDESCKSEWECVDKKEVPEVELFVMSHCPYGTQMEKAVIPAIKHLGDKVDFKLKFVNYAMHDMKEINEQMRQYCISQDYPEKLIPYLECFLDAGKTDECLEEFGLKGKLDECVEATDKKFGITEDYEDKTTWKGRFPTFNIHDADNQKYGVRGSPHLIINEAEPPVQRNPNSVLDAICFAFEDAPEECDEDISTTSPSAGFGYETTADPGATQAQCG